MRFAQLVIGAAGSGKSTYCAAVARHCETIGRRVHVVNLDPAADEHPINADRPPSPPPSTAAASATATTTSSSADEQQPPSFSKGDISVDIRELVQLEDVAEALELGPNGGLMYCMEYLAANLDWLRAELGSFEDDYLVIDCPGQIELYVHSPVMRSIVDALRQLDYRVCAVYLLDSQYLVDPAKFVSGSLAAMAAMIQLELPHVNVLSKTDMLGKHAKRQSFMSRCVAGCPSRSLFSRARSAHCSCSFLDFDVHALMDEVRSTCRPQQVRLNVALAELVCGRGGRVEPLCSYRDCRCGSLTTTA
jgi:GTPase SAR1 family protein